MQAEGGISLSLVIEEDGSRVQAADAMEEAQRHWKGWKKDSPTSQALYDDALFSSKHALCSTTLPQCIWLGFQLDQHKSANK